MFHPNFYAKPLKNITSTLSVFFSHVSPKKLSTTGTQPTKKNKGVKYVKKPMGYQLTPKVSKTFNNVGGKLTKQDIGWPTYPTKS